MIYLFSLFPFYSVHLFSTVLGVKSNNLLYINSNLRTGVEDEVSVYDHIPILTWALVNPAAWVFPVLTAAAHA